MASLADRLRPRWLILVVAGIAAVLGAAAALAPTFADTIADGGGSAPRLDSSASPASLSSEKSPSAAASATASPSPSASESSSAEAAPAKAAVEAAAAATPVGYASMNGGTAGGHGAATAHEYVLSEVAGTYGGAGDALYALLDEQRDRGTDEGLVIYVDTTISDENLSEDAIDVKDVQHVSILGVGTSGELDGVGITVTRSHDVVIRNLAIHHVDTGEKDAVSITDHSTNIWVDHNELYSDLAADEDYYDGLVDVKRNSAYVTISWNYIHDHWKTSLVGHDDEPSLAPDNITYAFNHFRHVNTRVPLIRYAHVHVLNNYFDTIATSAINARDGAQVLVEGNYFFRTGSGNVDSETGQIQGPVGWWYGSDTGGSWNLRDNAFEETAHEHLSSTTDFTVPYAYTALSPGKARAAVLSGAGTGVLNIRP
ncbi:polysaccharide lyase family 1 protein [Promicromonospora sp. NPDC057138]|uniref:pectate lyase family protein n=1 Tax=Promicromonospora sp. NPDC057138 TaxID=3346031 RepID=UPI00363616B5